MNSTTEHVDLKLIEELAKIVKEYALDSLTVGGIVITKKMHILPPAPQAAAQPEREIDEDLLFHSAGV